MCGICGIINSSSVDRHIRDSVVRKMNDQLYHRGPDEDGYASFEKVSMAMRRLSIIDLQSGGQPIFNEDNSIALFFNGEIYNFQNLRQELQTQGHQFRTTSDSEVLVHLYEQYKLRMMDRLDGMFAFSLYDKIEKRVIIARDRFGEKPLYYYEKNGKVSYSSELKSLLRNPEIPRVLNMTALRYYLKVGIVPEPLTLFEGIYALPPGHLMVINEDGLSIQRYFDPQFRGLDKFKSENEAIDCIFPLFEEAVKKQMTSDVPIGAFLSGGIDSSSVVAMMQKNSANKIKTYTVQFENTSYDESKIAKEVAGYLKTEHHEIFVQNQGFSEELFWNLLDHIGMPFSDSSCIPTYLVTREISKHVKVALSGDGGDEVFGGYRVFHWWNKILDLQKIPVILRQFVVKSASVLTERSELLSNSSIMRQLNKAVNLSFHTHRDIPMLMHQMFDEYEMLKFFKVDESNGFDYILYRDYFDENINGNDLRQIMNYRLKYNLPSNMLVKVDRMSMANSLEVRAPFLDPILFQASLRLPGNMLLRNGLGKYILRKMMKEHLPKSVFDHPKQGFAIPLHTYQNKQYRALANSLFSKKHPLNQVLSLDKVRSVQDIALGSNSLKANVSTYRASQRLWALIMLYGWMNHFDVGLPD